jgi:hypothetical protein
MAENSIEPKVTDGILRMKFAGRFIDLLGYQMYGGPVASLSELIANSWDADAAKVEISIPPEISSKNAEITVRDYGEGMSFEEIDNYYLLIGYERRIKRGERTQKKRLVMGRKGIGKLAGFGIAEDMTIRSIKNNQVVQFTLNYNSLKSQMELTDLPIVPEINEHTEEENGVKISLKKLKLGKNINIDNFRKSISRRFALNSEEMEIIINNEKLLKEDLDLKYRIPEVGWAEEDINDLGKVQYWFGFLKDTIKDSELRGISVFARERIAQLTPFHFNLSGGITGQVGLEYLTGQLKADSLDSDIDHISTPRQSVNWLFGNAPILEKWGQNKIKELCKDWKKIKDEENKARFKHTYSQFFPIINNLPEQEKQDITFALDKIATLEKIEPDEFEIIASSMISGIQRESVKKVIRKINVASEASFNELIEVVKEWDVISAVAAYEVVFGKIEIINQFKKYIDEKLPEKTKKGQIDMQDFIKSHPWLLGYDYEYLKPADFHHEHGTDKWIEEELIKVDSEFSSSDKREGRRFDLLVIKNDWQIVILELMRPSTPADYDHVMRLNRYVTRIQSVINDSSTVSKYKGKSVYGLLLADDFVKDTSLNKTIQDLRNNIDAVTWKGLFENVYSRYKDFADILKMKAPEDPRIIGLVGLA